MFFILIVGNKNFKRECERIYEQIAILIKLEDKFGLYRNLKSELNIIKDKNIFPKRYFKNDQEKGWNTTEDFIEYMMGRKNTLYSNMRNIFRIFFLIAIILTFFIIGLIMLHLQLI